MASAAASPSPKVRVLYSKFDPKNPRTDVTNDAFYANWNLLDTNGRFVLTNGANVFANSSGGGTTLALRTLGQRWGGAGNDNVLFPSNEPNAQPVIVIHNSDADAAHLGPNVKSVMNRITQKMTVQGVPYSPGSVIYTPASLSKKITTKDRAGNVKSLAPEIVGVYHVKGIEWNAVHNGGVADTERKESAELVKRYYGSILESFEDFSGDNPPEVLYLAMIPGGNYGGSKETMDGMLAAVDQFRRKRHTRNMTIIVDADNPRPKTSATAAPPTPSPATSAPSSSASSPEPSAKDSLGRPIVVGDIVQLADEKATGLSLGYTLRTTQCLGRDYATGQVVAIRNESMASGAPQTVVDVTCIDAQGKPSGPTHAYNTGHLVVVKEAQRNGYFEHQDGNASCGRHALNHILQRPVWVLSGGRDLKTWDELQRSPLTPNESINLLSMCAMMNKLDSDAKIKSTRFSCDTTENYSDSVLIAALNITGHFVRELLERTGTPQPQAAVQELQTSEASWFLANLGNFHWVAFHKSTNADGGIHLTVYDSLLKAPLQLGPGVKYDAFNSIVQLYEVSLTNPWSPVDPLDYDGMNTGTTPPPSDAIPQTSVNGDLESLKERLKSLKDQRKKLQAASSGTDLTDVARSVDGNLPARLKSLRGEPVAVVRRGGGWALYDESQDNDSTALLKADTLESLMQKVGPNGVPYGKYLLTGALFTKAGAGSGSVASVPAADARKWYVIDKKWYHLTPAEYDAEMDKRKKNSFMSKMDKIGTTVGRSVTKPFLNKELKVKASSSAATNAAPSAVKACPFDTGQVVTYMGTTYWVYEQHKNDSAGCYQLILVNGANNVTVSQADFGSISLSPQPLPDIYNFVETGDVIRYRKPGDKSEVRATAVGTKRMGDQGVIVAYTTNAFGTNVNHEYPSKFCSLVRRAPGRAPLPTDAVAFTPGTSPAEAERRASAAANPLTKQVDAPRGPTVVERALSAVKSPLSMATSTSAYPTISKAVRPPPITSLPASARSPNASESAQSQPIPPTSGTTPPPANPTVPPVVQPIPPVVPPEGPPARPVVPFNGTDILHFLGISEDPVRVSVRNVRDKAEEYAQAIAGSPNALKSARNGKTCTDLLQAIMSKSDDTLQSVIDATTERRRTNPEFAPKQPIRDIIKYCTQPSGGGRATRKHLYRFTRRLARRMK